MNVHLGGADIIANGARLAGRAVRIEAGRITAIVDDDPALPGRAALPSGSLLAPGFIDIQANGGGGIQFNDEPTAGAARAIAAAHRRLGTTAILPTLMTDDAALMPRAVAAVEAAGEGVIGLHLEGPFISKARPGVHRPELIRRPGPDDLSFLAALPARLGKPVVVTLAPEEMPSGAIATLRKAGLRVSAGHSAASFTEMPAVDAYTHVFNAMGAVSARVPGIIAAALLDDGAWCGVIADGIHVDPAMLRVLLRCKPAGRIMLVSDAMAPAGTTATEFLLQGRRISRCEGRLITEDGTLAGADLSLAQAVRLVAALGVPLPEAVAMASANPALFLGLAHERGAIAPGLRADFTLLSAGLEVLGTWVAGQWEAAV